MLSTSEECGLFSHVMYVCGACIWICFSIPLPTLHYFAAEQCTVCISSLYPTPGACHKKESDASVR